MIYLFVAVLLFVFVFGFTFFSARAGFSSCGTWAKFPHDICSLPRPAIKPVFLALAGRFLTTGRAGESVTEDILRISDSRHSLGGFEQQKGG